MTAESEEGGVSRREFVKAGVVAAAAASLPLTAAAQQPEEKEGKETAAPMPRRVLGRTGEKVTMLAYGATGEVTRRMLNAMWDAGIRYADTADCYVNGKHEKDLGEWVAKKGCRKELFIVTKDHPNAPDEFVTMADARLKNMQSDYIDLYFIHGLGEPKAGYKIDLKEMIEVPKSKDWAQAVEKLKKSGKIRFAGIALHGEVPVRVEIMNNAVAGGWIDAMMLMYDPQTVQESPEFNKALDACHKAGIGLVTMKQCRRLAEAKKDEKKEEEAAAAVVPEFKKMGLTPHLAILNAVWTDERIASICSAMPNLKILKENTKAAREFKPLDKKQMASVVSYLQQHGRRYCNACDGRCRRAAGTNAALNHMVRYLAYFEADGCREEARRLYAALTPEERNWHGADLEAASRACASKLDFAALLRRAEQKLA